MDKKLNFLMVSNFNPDPNSGTPGTVFAIGNALKALGHDVDFEWKAKRTPWFSQPGFYRFLELPIVQFGQVRKRLREKKYDVVIISQIYAYQVYEKLAPKYPGTLFLNLSHGWEDRVYHQSHLWEPSLTGFGIRRLSRFLTHRACLRTAQGCHGLMASAIQTPRYISVTCGIPLEKIHPISYGLDPEYLNLETSSREKSEDIRMLYVGNYLPIKGSLVMERLLPEAASRFPGATMTFVVPASQVGEIRQKYEVSFGSRLKVLPWMKREELLKTYQQHDLLLFPSLFEGFGKSFLEAMACGLCVVGYGEGGLPGAAVSGQEALFCEAGKEEELKKLLFSALSNPARVREIGGRAHEKVKHFSWTKTAGDIVDYCLKLRREMLANV